VASVGHQATTKVLYVGTMTLSALVLALMSLVIARNDHIRDTDERPDHVRAFATVATFVVILAAMLAFPGLSYWPLLLLLAPDRLVALWRHRSATADDTAQDTP
jgi:uncharacterized membrane protein